LKVNFSNCAICDSSWGNVWQEVEGTRLFFCCDICVTQFRNLVDRIKLETGWPTIDELEIVGDRRGRSCRALRGTDSMSCEIAFNAQGNIRAFEMRERPLRGT
jgi:Ta0938